jgi:HlyD family secretion protein
MNANADIKTKTKSSVLSVPITAVAARVKGSDESVEDKKKEKKKEEQTEAEQASFVESDDLEEVVFVLNNEGQAEKRVIKTGIQDIEYIEVLSGLKPGEQVITAPYNAISKTLKPGTKVKVVASKEELIEKK